ncbi:MAG: hypothetical protein P8O86_09795 [Actinomycetota bacterium]|jgi:hypothetical protein|nr:hypothetical protein [Actinomycetota bacterium]MDG2120904.1 hypothetical protein [Actinomycetota bacterium]|tara:strand:+ start:245 stop:403 length:159 start_codon:yes stop_codon:yes gene_type:complete
MASRLNISLFPMAEEVKVRGLKGVSEGRVILAAVAAVQESKTYQSTFKAMNS